MQVVRGSVGIHEVRYGGTNANEGLGCVIGGEQSTQAAESDATLAPKRVLAGGGGFLRTGSLRAMTRRLSVCVVSACAPRSWRAASGGPAHPIGPPSYVRMHVWRSLPLRSTCHALPRAQPRAPSRTWAGRGRCRGTSTRRRCDFLCQCLASCRKSSSAGKLAFGGRLFSTRFYLHALTS